VESPAIQGRAKRKPSSKPWRIHKIGFFPIELPKCGFTMERSILILVLAVTAYINV
jgi:hypothetical protein